MPSSTRNHRLDSGPLARSLKAGVPFLVLAVLLLAALPPALAAQEGQAFDPGCPLPYAGIAVKHPIDSNCGVEGISTADGPNHLQNRAKNNFCASGEPVTVTQSDFVNLQAAVAPDKANVACGSTRHLPANRSVLHDIYKTSGGATIGEGTQVRFVAFIDNAHYSDVGPGEAVNCKEHGNEPNDIHIPTVQSPGDNECSSVTAEMSPHSRPDAWTDKALNSLGVPVRITGQLFFDASHCPCTEGHQQPPKRISSWEIHPVYGIDVCTAKTLADCPVGDDTKWHPLTPPPAH
ncbi:MAG TPA: hypothetical protein VHR45_24255 [Thermoanaerobaculia bacterium]|nr:hypothetical protein [Thermoanaerobaculia bacterium]